MSETGETLVDGLNNDFINQQIFQSEAEVATESCTPASISADEIPKWLQKSLLEDALQKHFKSDGIKVLNLKISYCGGKGDNFASSMYRVGTYYCEVNEPEKTKFISCILKTLPESEMAQTYLGSQNYNIQNKEMLFYEKILPEFERILESIGESEDIFPKVMAVYRDIDLIVLEDLMERNFVMANRLESLDLTHTKFTLRSLAKMHAASMVLHEENNEAFKVFDTGFYTRKTNCFHVFFESLLEVFTEEISTWTDWPASGYYHEKLIKLQQNLIPYGRRSFDFDEKDLNVLTHGDLWTNNVMFQYDKVGKPKAALLIDFQYGFFGSAALDLHYFLYTSIYDDLKVDRMEELIQYYYSELKELLSRLNYDMEKLPSLHDFQLEVYKRNFYSFSTCFLSFPVMLCQDDDADFEALMSKDDRAMGFKRRVYKNPRFKSIAMRLLPIFDRKGILDEL